MKTPHISEYLSFEEVSGVYKCASAEQPAEKKKTDWKQVIKLLGAGAAGSAVGGLAGFGALELTDRALGGGGAASSKMGIPSSVLNKIVPIAGAGAGLTYTLWKLREMEKLRHAVQPSSDDSSAAQ
jgi:hypothetical protein